MKYKILRLLLFAALIAGGLVTVFPFVWMVLSSFKSNGEIEALNQTLLPQVLDVVKTYCRFHGVEVTVIPAREWTSDKEAMVSELASGDVAGVLVPGINRYGVIEDFTSLADSVHSAKALLVIYSDPSSLAVIRTPGEWGADIVCGDAQTLGIPLNFGGPYLGFLCCRQEYVRKLPGRIVGQTEDADGKRCYVLTLQAREL